MQALALPPRELRWGGPQYADDDCYIRSGIDNAKMMAAECGVGANSRVLDIGCGPGRVFTGLIHHFGGLERYVGLDVHRPSIDWLQTTIAPDFPFAEFRHINVHNARYNRAGTHSLPAIGERFDCIVLFSVFSHMMLDDIRSYFAFIRESLATDGKVFLTAFVEDDVPSETENPDGYIREWKGALHCVRINRQIFERIAIDAGLQIKRFRHRITNDGQSSYVLDGQSFYVLEGRVSNVLGVTSKLSSEFAPSPTHRSDDS